MVCRTKRVNVADLFNPAVENNCNGRVMKLLKLRYWGTASMQSKLNPFLKSMWIFVSCLHSKSIPLHCRHAKRCATFEMLSTLFARNLLYCNKLCAKSVASPQCSRHLTKWFSKVLRAVLSTIWYLEQLFEWDSCLSTVQSRLTRDYCIRICRTLSSIFYALHNMLISYPLARLYL